MSAFSRSISWSVLSVLSLAIAASTAQAKPEVLSPALVEIIPDRMFAPQGFDDNDNAQIILDGELSDTCYKLGPTDFTVDHANQKIYIRQKAYYYPGSWCAQVRVPYMQTVNLGILNAGQYEIVHQPSESSSKLLGILPVGASTTSSPDEFLYAPVSNAYLRKVGEAGTLGGQTLFLTGTFQTSCMRFKEIKTLVRKGNVIEVLPIAEMDREGCSQLTVDFSVPVTMSQVPHGRYLIHVRSLNGQSINRIADL